MLETISKIVGHVDYFISEGQDTQMQDGSRRTGHAGRGGGGVVRSRLGMQKNGCKKASWMCLCGLVSQMTYIMRLSYISRVTRRFQI